MTTASAYCGFVRTDDGRFLVQLPADNGWGFSLHDDGQEWPGGFGAAGEWVAVSTDAVPDDEQDRLGWILESEA